MNVQLIFVFCIIISILSTALFVSIVDKKAIKKIKSNAVYWEEVAADRKKRHIDAIQEILGLRSELDVIKMLHKSNEQYVIYNSPEAHPAITDWYTVVRRSGLYKTLFRDRALFDAGTKRWGGPEDDPVVYWLLNIPLPDETARFHKGD